MPRGAAAAQDSTGTLITFDSAAAASRFSINQWIQSGLLTSNIRQVAAVGGNSLSVSGAALTVTKNDRIFLIGSTQPTVSGGSATYTTPNTLIRKRDDDAADLYTNSMVTTNSDGLIQAFGSPALYDVLIQDGNQGNQGSIIDLELGTVQGVSVVDWAYFGSSVTISGALVVGSTVTVKNINSMLYADGYATGSSTGGIQEAINALPAGGGVVMLTRGASYSPTVAISLISRLVINGNGATIFRTSGLNTLNIFKDSGSALSRVTLRDIVFDNNSLATSVKDIDLTGGATDITVEGNRWINLMNRVSDLTRIQASASKGARINWRNNAIVGPGSQQTYNSFQIYDCDNVDASGNVIDGWGAIKLEGALAATLYNWSVTGNRLKNIAQSNIFARIQGGASVASVCVSDNLITDCGKAGIVIDAINAGDTGSITNVSVTGNAIRGFALSLADSGIAVGGIVTSGSFYMHGVAVSGNVVDGKDSTGTRPADQNRGIQISQGVQHFSVTGNVAENCGRDGIMVAGSIDGTITGNVIDGCVKQDTGASVPTPTQEGGITIYSNDTYATTRIVVANNLSKNNGVSGSTISYGINLGPNSGAIPASKLFCYGNVCYDDQATKTQNYGIIVGSIANPGPTDSVVVGNDLRGNSTGGILGPLGTVTGVFLRDNIPNDGITKAIVLASDSITPSAARVLLSGNTAATLTSAPTVLDGYWNGQEIEVMNIGTTGSITIQDQGTLPSSNLRLGAASRAIGPRDSLRLRFDSTIGDWVETGFNNVT